MSLVSIEKMKEDIFFGTRSKLLLKKFVRSIPHIMRCRLDWWEDLIEYMVPVTGNS